MILNNKFFFTPLNTFVVKNVYETEDRKYIELDFVYFD